MTTPANLTLVRPEWKDLQFEYEMIVPGEAFPDLDGLTLAVDVETKPVAPIKKAGLSAFHGELLGVSVGCPEKRKCWYVPLRHRAPGSARFNVDPVATADWLGNIMRRSTLLLNQNFKFDAKFLDRAGVKAASYDHVPLFDTQVASVLIDERVESGLKPTAKRVLGMEPDEEAAIQPYIVGNKDFQDWSYIPADLMAPYGCGDVERAIRLAGAQRALLAREEVEDLFTLEMDVLRDLIHMELRGHRVDVDALKRDLPQLIVDEIHCGQRIEKLVGACVNYGSAADLAEVFISRLGLPILSSKPGMRNGKEVFTPVFDDAVLQSYARHYPQHAELMFRIRQARRLEHIKSFVQSYLELQVDGAVHTNIKQVEARTGRESSEMPNLQQISGEEEWDDPSTENDDAFFKKPQKWIAPGCEKYFLAREGHTILSCDYSQIEYRFFAHYLKFEPLLERYRNDPTVDLHQWAADDVLQGMIGRDDAKSCVVGDTRILTEQGYRRIDELCGKDVGRHSLRLNIVSDDAVRITDSYYAAEDREVFNVETELGMKVVATADHEFPIVRDSKIVMLALKDIKEGDYTILRIGTNAHGNNYTIPFERTALRTSYRPVDLPKQLDAETARFLGYFVSEGRYELRGYSIAFGLGFVDDDFVADLEHCFRRVAGDRVLETVSHRDIRYRACSRDLCMWLHELGCGGSSIEKKIPAVIEAAPWHIKREFLRAYFEGDGCVKGDVVSCTSKSETLIRQIHAELLNVGVVGSINKEVKPKYGAYWSWCARTYAEVRNFEKKIGFISKRKVRELKNVEARRVRSSLFLDGCTEDWKRASEGCGTVSEDVRQLIRKGSRVGDLQVSRIGDRLKGTAAYLRDHGLWTVRIRSIVPAGTARVYDLYEPEHKLMIAGGLVVGDCNFGIVFGMGDKKLVNFMATNGKGITEQQAAAALDYYYKVLPLEELQNDVGRALVRRGFVRTILGRRRRGSATRRQWGQARDKKKDRGLEPYQALNAICQGGAVDLLKHRSIEASKLARQFGGALLLKVHDDVKLEVPTEHALELARLVKPILETFVKADGTPYLSLPIYTKCTATTTSWYDAKTLKLEEAA